MAPSTPFDTADAQMEATGVDRLDLNARGKRYFAHGYTDDDPSPERPDLRPFLFGDTMAQLCRATLGDDAYLFFENYVIKASNVDTAFSWHQDSGYVHEDHLPYLTCWIALDDITEDNGPVHLLPYSRSGIRSYAKHIRDPRTNDMVCYFGSDPGMPIVGPAGTVVCFSSFVMHRSGPNLTDRLRRAYIVQYSGDVIMSKDGTEPYGSFEQFLKSGATATHRR